ncbi:MAG: hypothetical protein ACK50A_11910 [Sphingobacteriaceae bacterium]|jgi:uncharacterized Fe-S cluster-containing radical SAM superfamily protein
MKTTVIKVVIKPYTNKELAKIFNASESTHRRRMAKIRHHLGERHGHFWNVKQVEQIMTLLDIGTPFEIIHETT